MSLADERRILKEISVIQKSKSQLEEQGLFERKVQDIKVSFGDTCCVAFWAMSQGKGRNLGGF